MKRVHPRRRLLGCKKTPSPTPTPREIEIKKKKDFARFQASAAMSCFLSSRTLSGVDW